MRLSPEQLKAFDDEGYLFLPDCFSDEEVALLRREARRARAAARDAAERARRWEDQARAQEEAHARFMRELDHELKNPLQAIKTAFADLE